jgi:hypothetical protein
VITVPKVFVDSLGHVLLFDVERFIYQRMGARRPLQTCDKILLPHGTMPPVFNERHHYHIPSCVNYSMEVYGEKAVVQIKVTEVTKRIGHRSAPVFLGISRQLKCGTHLRTT